MTRHARPRVEALDGRCLPSFSPAVSFPVGTNPSAVATAEFDGDGRLDVVTADWSSGTVGVRLGRGDGTLIRPEEYAAGWSPTAVAVGDFNGDGRPDVVAADFDPGAVWVLLNDGTWPA